jgi:hypothetical protein
MDISAPPWCSLAKWRGFHATLTPGPSPRELGEGVGGEGILGGVKTERNDHSRTLNLKMRNPMLLDPIKRVNIDIDGFSSSSHNITIISESKDGLRRIRYSGGRMYSKVDGNEASVGF